MALAKATKIKQAQCSGTNNLEMARYMSALYNGVNLYRSMKWQKAAFLKYLMASKASTRAHRSHRKQSSAGRNRGEMAAKAHLYLAKLSDNKQAWRVMLKLHFKRTG